MKEITSHSDGYKHTPLGWIPSEWQILQQSDVATFYNGKAYKQEELLETGKYRVLRVGNLYTNNNWYYSNLELEANKYVENGDLIYAWSASFGPRFWTEERTIYHYHIWKVECKNMINKQFLYYSLDGLTRKLKAKSANGMGMLHVTKGDMESALIRVPKLKEQSKIALILMTWDKAISHEQEFITQLKCRNNRLIYELLQEKHGWISIKMSEAFERVIRKNNEGNTNVVTISAQRGFIKQSDYFSKNIASEILDKYFLVDQGEFCYNKSYSKGYDWGAIKRLNNIDKAVVTSLYICFGIKDKKKYSGNFFEHFFDACKLDGGLSKIAHEGGRAHGLLNVTSTDFFNLKIKIPPFEQQNSIAEILSKAKLEVNLHEQKLRLLQTQKKGLMQKLLTGEIRVKLN